MATCALSCSVRKGSQTRSVIKPPSLGKMCSRSILYGANYHSPFPSVKPPTAPHYEVCSALREKAFDPVGRGLDSLSGRAEAVTYRRWSGGRKDGRSRLPSLWLCKPVFWYCDLRIS